MGLNSQNARQGDKHHPFLVSLHVFPLIRVCCIAFSIKKYLGKMKVHFTCFPLFPLLKEICIRREGDKDQQKIYHIEIKPSKHPYFLDIQK